MTRVHRAPRSLREGERGTEMSRSGYSEEGENIWLWRGAVQQAASGKRGQQFFKDLVAALDAMPVKELIREALIDGDGGVCAMGSLGLYRKVDMGEIDVNEPREVGKAFNIASALAQEVAWMNDERYKTATPAELWSKMRAWAEKQIGKPNLIY